MRKPRGILDSMAQNYKRRAIMNTTIGLYKLMWGEKPKRPIVKGDNKNK